MRLSRLLPCVVIAGMVGVSVFGQNEPATDFDRSVFRAPAVEEAAEPTVPARQSEETDRSPAETVAEDERELRKQYLQLIEQKKDLMDRSALREAISRTERDIDELKATEKLHQARQHLLEIVKSHPKTSAAQAAREMLQADPERRPLFPDTFRTPEPYEVPKRNVLPPSSTFDRGATIDRGDGIFPSDGNAIPRETPSRAQPPPLQDTPVQAQPRKRGQDDERFPGESDSGL